MNLPPGISISEAMAQIRAVRGPRSLEIPDVTTVVSKAGRPEDGTDPKPLNMVEMFVGVQVRRVSGRADVTKGADHRGDGQRARTHPG